MQEKSWTRSEILKAMEANILFHMTYFAKYVPVVKILDEPDVVVLSSQIPDDSFNYAISARFTENNVEERVQHVTQIFKKDSLPFSWWVWEWDTPPNLKTNLVKQGLELREEYAGMYLDLAEFQPHSSAPELRLQRVNSQDELKNFAQVITAFGIHPQAYDLIYSKLPSSSYQEGAPYNLYVGYVDDKPVVTGLLVLHDRVAGIYYVATAHPYQRKGYATAMMENLLGIAKSKGYLISTLQASLAGKGVYERLGFTQCCALSELESKF